MITSLGNKRIVIALTGSISAYKACALISSLMQKGHEVRTVLTESAQKFVGAASLEGLTGSPPLQNIFSDGENMAHIELGKWADITLVYPATANCINSLSSGLGNDFLGSYFLAYDLQKPFIIAPAMNHRMLNHPTTQRSIAYLSKMNVEFVYGRTGHLACGETGDGRLIEPENMFEHLFPKNKTLDPKVLITGGGTQEPIDGVRQITNFSTGFTSHSLFEKLTSGGFDVDLVMARNSKFFDSSNPKHFGYGSFHDLNTTLRRKIESENYHCVIHSAAVSDYSVSSIQIGDHFIQASDSIKLPSSESEISIQLKRNFKIIDKLKSYSNCSTPSPVVIGFKLTKNASKEMALDSVENLFLSGEVDFIVHNDLSDISVSEHQFRIYQKDKFPDHIDRGTTKNDLAKSIEDIVCKCIKMPSLKNESHNSFSKMNKELSQ